MKKDNLNPSYYKDGKIEVMDFIKDKKLNFARGNVVKYVSRAGKKNKDKEIEDLEKARWYLDNEIKTLRTDCECQSADICGIKGLEEALKIAINDVYGLPNDYMDTEDLLRRRKIKKMTESDKYSLKDLKNEIKNYAIYYCTTLCPEVSWMIMVDDNKIRIGVSSFLKTDKEIYELLNFFRENLLWLNYPLKTKAKKHISKK